MISKKGTRLLEEALASPPDERAESADRPLSSLDKKRQRKIEELWAEEVEDRTDAFERVVQPSSLPAEARVVLLDSS